MQFQQGQVIQWYSSEFNYKHKGHNCVVWPLCYHWASPNCDRSTRNASWQICNPQSTCTMSWISRGLRKVKSYHLGTVLLLKALDTSSMYNFRLYEGLKMWCLKPDLHSVSIMVILSFCILHLMFYSMHSILLQIFISLFPSCATQNTYSVSCGWGTFSLP